MSLGRASLDKPMSTTTPPDQSNTTSSTSNPTNLGILINTRQLSDDTTTSMPPSNLPPTSTSASTSTTGILDGRPPSLANDPPITTTTTTGNTNSLSRLLNPGVYANPAPLGLCAFALTCFTSSVATVSSKDTIAPDVVIASAFGYGGLVQILVGMWELARGNTFNATSFCSYGAYWITSSIISALGKFETLLDLGKTQSDESMGLYFMAWFILTTLLLLCTLKTNIALFLLFFFLDMNYLLLGITHLQSQSPAHVRSILPFQRAGGMFGLLAALAAWYNALAGIVNTNNSFFTLPMGHFPWSPINRQQLKSDEKLM